MIRRATAFFQSATFDCFSMPIGWAATPAGTIECTRYLEVGACPTWWAGFIALGNT